ncbi:MAG: transcriptional regulator GcvA [Pseudomonadota bacterium]
MSDRLPPLTALRAFDAAARHMSFAKAADELSVTPAALSFQIKSLEEHLGTPLFVRLNRAVELTETGKALAPGAEDGFQILSAAWRAAQRLQDEQTLTVTAGPAFTAKWLAPRLYEFAQAHPEIELRFSASLKFVDFARDAVDVAIRFSAQDGKGHYSLPLAQEWVAPVMTPELAQRYKTPDSLVSAKLIHDDSIRFMKPLTDWQAWFQAVGIDFSAEHGPRFSQADHAVDACLAGVGVVLGRRALVVKEIHEGRLIMPFPVALATAGRFRFVCPQGTENRPQVKAFRNWILAEIGKTTYITKSIDVRENPDT